MTTTRIAAGLLLLLALASTAAASEYSKTVPRQGGDLTINWGPAPAQPAQDAPDFAALDDNGDGRLTLQEAGPHRLLHSDFDYADRNRDGYISKVELRRWH